MSPMPEQRPTPLAQPPSCAHTTARHRDLLRVPATASPLPPPLLTRPPGVRHRRGIRGRWARRRRGIRWIRAAGEGAGGSGMRTSASELVRAPRRARVRSQGLPPPGSVSHGLRQPRSAPHACRDPGDGWRGSSEGPAIREAGVLAAGGRRHRRTLGPATVGVCSRAAGSPVRGSSGGAAFRVCKHGRGTGSLGWGCASGLIRACARGGRTHLAGS